VKKTGQSHNAWQVTDAPIGAEQRGQMLLGGFKQLERTVVRQPVKVIPAGAALDDYGWWCAPSI
jgi:hypothetical protein